MEMLTPFVKEAFQVVMYMAKFSCCVHVTQNHLCYFAYLTGPSMLPTFSNGDVVLVERISSRLGEIGSEDLVQLRTPDYPRKIVTKRVTAVEGDVVSYSLSSDEPKTVIVPKGHVWVEGDNAEVSNDSRKFGPVPYGLLQGLIFRPTLPPLALPHHLMVQGTLKLKSTTQSEDKYLSVSICCEDGKVNDMQQVKNFEDKETGEPFVCTESPTLWSCFVIFSLVATISVQVITTDLPLPYCCFTACTDSTRGMEVVLLDTRDGMYLSILITGQT